MNRQQAVNGAVRKYKAADKEFDAAMNEMKKESAALEVHLGFDYLSGFMSLQTICYMEVRLLDDYSHIHNQSKLCVYVL